MAKAVNPIKAIKGGITQVKNTATAVKMNNQNVKAGTAVQAIGKAPPTKQVMGPLNVAKAFAAGAKDPKGAALRAGQLKAMKGK
ncbi:MAG: hypothetical protein WC718_15770 [Phycisphaerales bacterium]|jgi:hypothetical protein